MMGRAGIGRRAAVLGAAALGGCAGLGAGVAVERDIAYAERPGALLDLYRPAAPAGPLPAVVYFHGGGWAFGRKDELQDALFAGRLAARGFVVASAEYRLLPEARFPNFLEDGAAAAAWVHRNAASVGADPGRLVFAGHSAGAYNAVMLAVDRRYTAAAGLPPGTVRGGIGLAGPYGAALMEGPLVGAAFPAALREEALVVRHLGPATPPLLLLAGSLDIIVPPAETRALAEAAGPRAEAILYPGIGHLGILAAGPWLPSLAPVLEDATRFLRRVA